MYNDKYNKLSERVPKLMVQFKLDRIRFRWKGAWSVAQHTPKMTL